MAFLSCQTSIASFINVKTIAISIDEATLAALDRIAKRSPGRPSKTAERAPSRSEIVRRAVQEFLAREEKREREERERKIWHRHRKQFDREARALIREQAKS